MNLLKKLLGVGSPAPAPPSVSTASAGLPRAGQALPAALQAHSQFIKRINCPRCGAPKTLPSATAYLYCDYCGSLMDYDFRLANANTNAGVTNTVFHRLMTPVQNALAQAKARGDRDTFRQLYRQVYAQWVQECPMAVSPRVKGDAAFREQFIHFQVECAVTKDFDPRQAPLDAQMAAQLAALQRLPQPGGAWRVAGPFWEYAQAYKQQMELVYALLQSTGVLALDPDQAPAGVPLRMEYSTFCQSWLPHLSAADGQRLLEFYGLNAEYDQVQPTPTALHRCGGCGAQLHTVPGARQVVCEACGRSLDIAGGDVPCRQCGAHLSFPVAARADAGPIRAAYATVEPAKAGDSTDRPKTEECEYDEQGRQLEGTLARLHGAGHNGPMIMNRQAKAEGIEVGIQEAVEYVYQCEICGRTNPRKAFRHPLTAKNVDEPFLVVSVDEVAVPQDADGIVTVVVMRCVHSGCVMLEPVVGKDSGEAARAMLRCFSYYGLPRYIESDQGTEFVGAKIQKIMEILRVEWKLITAYEPQARSAERSVRDVVSLLRKLNLEMELRYAQVLPLVQMVLNARIGVDGSSPFEVMTGRRTALWKESEQLEEREWEVRIKELITEIWPSVAKEKAIRRRARNIKKDMKEKKRMKTWEKGQEVMVNKLNPKNKLDVRRDGPYRVKEIQEVDEGERYILEQRADDQWHEIPGTYQSSQLTKYHGKADMEGVREIREIVEERIDSETQEREYKVVWLDGTEDWVPEADVVTKSVVAAFRQKCRSQRVQSRGQHQDENQKD